MRKGRNYFRLKSTEVAQTPTQATVHHKQAARGTPPPARPPSRTPPPAYKDAISKNLKMSNANINPGSGAAGAGHDALKLKADSELMYITPLSDDDDVMSDTTQADDEGEDGYLSPRRITRIQSDHDSDYDNNVADEKQKLKALEASAESGFNTFPVAHKRGVTSADSGSARAKSEYIPMNQVSRYDTPKSRDAAAADDEEDPYLSPVKSEDAHVYLNGP